MRDESAPIAPNSAESGATATGDRRARQRWPFVFFLSVTALTAMALSIACGGRDSDSPTAPSGPAWPAFATPFGLSIPHPPELQPTVLNAFRVGFSGQPLPPETDSRARIEFSSYSGAVAEHRTELRGDFETTQTDTVERVGAVEVFRLVGRLKPDIFGWGGTIHGYSIFERGGRAIVVDYDAEDPRTVEQAAEMVRRTLSP